MLKEMETLRKRVGKYCLCIFMSVSLSLYVCLCLSLSLRVWLSICVKTEVMLWFVVIFFSFFSFFFQTAKDARNNKWSVIFQNRGFEVSV